MSETEYLKAWGYHAASVHCPGFQPVKNFMPVIVWYNNGVMCRYIRPAKAWRFWTGGRDWWQKPLTDDRLYIERYYVVSMNIIEQYELNKRYAAFGLDLV